MGELKSVGDPRRIIRRWLYELIFEDWSLKLLALAITLGLWYGVTSQREPASIRLRSVPLEFAGLPPDMDISNDPRESVDVILRGNKQTLEELRARNLAVRADISSFKAGERVVRLTPQSVEIDLPNGIQIERIEPSNVSIRLERTIERVIEVAVRLEGKPPAGYEVRAIHVSPEAVRVSGPQSHIEGLDKAHTESINLDGQKESFVQTDVSIDILDKKVTVSEPSVSVRIEIGEERIEKRFAGVAVSGEDGESKSVQPSSVNILLRGDRSIVNKLKAEELKVILEQTADGTIKPRLLLPSGAEGRVELVSIDPS